MILAGYCFPTLSPEICCTATLTLRKKQKNLPIFDWALNLLRGVCHIPGDVLITHLRRFEIQTV